MIRQARESSQPIQPLLLLPSQPDDEQTEQTENQIETASTAQPLVVPQSSPTPSEPTTSSSISTPSGTASRPLGAKKSIEKVNLTQAINRSAKLFESLLDQTKKKDETLHTLMDTIRERNKVEKLREERELFDSPSVDADMRSRYIKYRTKQVLDRLCRIEQDTQPTDSTLLTQEDGNIQSQI